MEELTYDELRSRLLPGYMYSMDSGEAAEGERSVRMHTGVGGAGMMIDVFERKGMPAWMAAICVQVHTKEGVYRLADIRVNTKV